MPNDDKINPAWKAILDTVPEALHGVLIPALRQWDAGVTQRFNEIHAQYEPLKAYKELADSGIDVEYAKNAVMFADKLQNDPKGVVERINEAANLGYVSPENAAKLGQQSSGLSDSDDDLFEGQDITKHPQFQAIAKGIETLQQQFEQQNQSVQEQQQIAEFESYLDSLQSTTEEKNLPFNRRYVTALMTQGMTGEQALAEYHKELAIQTVDTTATTTTTETNTLDDPLVVMGGDGSAGSGTPDGAFKVGSLGKNDFMSTVEQLLEQSLGSGQ